jgi:hypothetical protein
MATPKARKHAWKGRLEKVREEFRMLYGLLIGRFGRKEPQVGDTLGSYRRRTDDHWSQSWWTSAISFLGFPYIGAILTATASGIRLFNDYSLAVGPNTFVRCICCQIGILRHLIVVDRCRFLSQVVPCMYQNTNFGVGISMLRGFISNLSGSETIQQARKKFPS